MADDAEGSFFAVSTSFTGKIAAYFSCGAASAITTKLLLHRFPKAEIAIVRCVVKNEHPDNDRFAVECERWFGRPILNLFSTEYRDCWDVWEKRRFIAGPKGAPCTTELKKAVRWWFEKGWNPEYGAFGFTSEEVKRAERFRQQNPEVRLLTPLIDMGVDKERCKQLLLGAGIKPSVMYDLGFENANCICCGKASSIVYWARCRAYFPEQFARMAALSRTLGARLTRLKGKRIFLDEIPNDIVFDVSDGENVECGILCMEEPHALEG